MGFFGKPQETLGTREVETGLSYSIFGKNQIDTAKYNWFTFLPLNLVEQFSKNSNIYFLVLIILQCIKTISITEGVPTVLPSLVIIVIFSAFKDFLEDFQRWKSDAAENQSKVMRYLFRQMGKGFGYASFMNNVFIGGLIDTGICCVFVYVIGI